MQTIILKAVLLTDVSVSFKSFLLHFYCSKWKSKSNLKYLRNHLFEDFVWYFIFTWISGQFNFHARRGMLFLRIVVSIVRQFVRPPNVCSSCPKKLLEMQKTVPVRNRVRSTRLSSGSSFSPFPFEFELKPKVKEMILISIYFVFVSWIN